MPTPAVREFAGVAATRAPGASEWRSPEAHQLRDWVAGDLPPLEQRPPLEFAVTHGLPGVEIPRFAETHDADLVVLGRKRRTERTRLLLGDTADAVARRSRLPCLFVQSGARPIRRVMAALDGTDRGVRVLHAARGFAAAVGAELRLVTVERVHAGEPTELAAGLPTEGSARLQRRIQETLGEHGGVVLDIRRGPVVEQVLAAVEESTSDVLVVGYHRGGSPGILDVGSTARRLAHTASSAVLTIPL
jgi:nucleotide-binding universal stress UspA family protein